jgi:hypothetical protein
MKETEVRKFHRSLGIVAVWFLVVQAVTGLLLAAFGDGGSFIGAMAAIHHEWNPVGSVYRVILALATTAQGVSGIIIYFLMRKRMRKS